MEFEDNINPKYYDTESGIETIDVIEAFNFNYLEGNIFKYLSRYKKKNGIEDLKKCQWYLNKLIEKNKLQ